MTKLDEIALNIELVLISVIQGITLYNLADNSLRYLHDFRSLEFLPYIIAGFIILFVFWSQAILHAISFIRWPLKMEHMCLYFLAAFIQVVAYNNMDNMIRWFFWWTIFSLVTLITYWVDLRLIRQMKQRFSFMHGGSEFIHEVERRHESEFSRLIPAALGFNIVLLVVATLFPEFFTSPLSYAIPGILQLAISIGALVDCVRNFQTRSMDIARIFDKSVA